MKRTLCILLSLLLAVTGFAGLCVPAAAADWQTGDVVTLGSYPQSRVTGDADQSRYANDYARSDLRQWLNSVFLNMAFSPQEQAVLTNTMLDNSADVRVSRPLYGSAATTDRVFLLSYADAQNAAYGFTDNASRRAKSSGYAKCQGAATTGDYAHWLLRSLGNSSRDVILVNYKGEIVTTNYAYTTDVGVRPAISAKQRPFSCALIIP